MRWRWMENIGQVETPFQWLVPQWRRRTSDHWFYWTLAMVFLTCPCYCCSYPLLVVMQEHHCVCDPGTSSSSILNILFVLQWTIINNAFVCLFVFFPNKGVVETFTVKEGQEHCLREACFLYSMSSLYSYSSGLSTHYYEFWVPRSLLRTHITIIISCTRGDNNTIIIIIIIIMEVFLLLLRLVYCCSTHVW